MKAGRCPVCKKQLERRGKNFPFCSGRCKLIDAGNWLDGKYRIGAEPAAHDWGGDG